MKVMLLFTLVLVAAVVEGYHLYIMEAGEDAADVQRMLGVHGCGEERGDNCTGFCFVNFRGTGQLLIGCERDECSPDEYGVRPHPVYGCFCCLQIA